MNNKHRRQSIRTCNRYERRSSSDGGAWGKLRDHQQLVSKNYYSAKDLYETWMDEPAIAGIVDQIMEKKKVIKPDPESPDFEREKLEPHVTLSDESRPRRKKKSKKTQSKDSESENSLKADIQEFRVLRSPLPPEKERKPRKSWDLHEGFELSRSEKAPLKASHDIIISNLEDDLERSPTKTSSAPKIHSKEYQASRTARKNSKQVSKKSRSAEIRESLPGTIDDF